MFKDQITIIEHLSDLVRKHAAAATTGIHKYSNGVLVSAVSIDVLWSNVDWEVGFDLRDDGKGGWLIWQYSTRGFNSRPSGHISYLYEPDCFDKFTTRIKELDSEAWFEENR